jgi:IS1 family transposase
VNTLPFEQQTKIVAGLVEGLSIRSVERLTGAHRDSVMRFGVRVGEGCARLHDRLMRDLPTHLVELDEIWSFIQKKQKRVRANDPTYMGDCYTWIALDAVNKAVLAYRVGKCSWEDCHAFIFDLRDRLSQRVQITSDGYAPYAPTTRAAFADVDYAQVQKVFEGDEGGQRDAAHRYSPARVVRVERETIFGAPEEDKISTSYVEPNNLTMRMQMRRFTCLTNGFSKKPENHRAAISLFVTYYNLVRIHETLRTTPAMALGVTDHVWTIGELVNAALTEPEPAPRPVTPEPDRGMSAGRAKGEMGRHRFPPRKLRVIRGGKLR